MLTTYTKVSYIINNIIVIKLIYLCANIVVVFQIPIAVGILRLLTLILLSVFVIVHKILR